MGIIINEPIILTEVQTKEFRMVVIAKDSNGKLTAFVSFNVLDEEGKVISQESLSYEGEEFNAFWVNFNNGKFLYEELIKDKEDIEVPEDIENEFLN